LDVVLERQWRNVLGSEVVDELRLTVVAVFAGDGFGLKGCNQRRIVHVRFVDIVICWEKKKFIFFN
jgi:hypothetical protein